MLKIFGARECIDKEKFIYDHIEGEAYVVVPEQYTLVAEEQALKYLGAECLYNTEIISMTRLGYRLLEEQGTENVRLLSKYGRFMLLQRIVNEHKDELRFFAKSAGRLGFTNMLSDFISEFKQHGCSMDELENMLGDSESGELLKAKLEELKGIIESYEAELSGRFTDAEDYVERYIAAIKESKHIKNKTVWIYGFDSFTPKNIKTLTELAKYSKGVNLVLNESDFGLHENMLAKIKSYAEECGVSCEYAPIEGTLLEKSDAIRAIEEKLWKDDAATFDGEPEGLTLVQAANQYYEAESAAAYIHGLIRDEGYKLRDINVICNNEKMQTIMKRVLAEYGLPVFMDSNREIKDTLAANFIINQLEFLRRGYNTDCLMSILKTGVTDVERGDVERLENYARNFKIKGWKWTRDFVLSESKAEESEESAESGENKELGDSGNLGEAGELTETNNNELKKLNAIRIAAVEPLLELERMIKKASTVAEFTDKYRAYLEERYGLADKIEAAAIMQEERGLNDEAQRTRESYEQALLLLDQMDEIMGDCKIELGEFIDVYSAGLMGVQVGVIPPALDGLNMGTMMRTRPRPAKAVIVVGVNEGITPLNPSTEGLFSVDEKAYFKRHNFALGSLDDIKMTEENVAMYRMLSHPSEKLYLSYSMTDAEGNDMSPSSIIDEVTDLFPALKTNKDIISEGWGIDIVNDRNETLRHLINHIKDRNTSVKGEALTSALLAWYKEDAAKTACAEAQCGDADTAQSSMLDRMLDAAQDDNVAAPLAAPLAKTLYSRGGDFVLSASKIEQYNGCPFRFYISYGLRPQEERKYESDARSIGDMYHECMMQVAKNLAARKASPGSYAAGGAASAEGEGVPFAAEGILTDDAAFAGEISPGAAAPDAGTACGDAATAPTGSPTMYLISDSELESLVNSNLDAMADKYRGGLFVSSGNEEFRLSRIKEICLKAATAMVRQLETGAVVETCVEEEYGPGRRFGQVELDVEGERVYIVGKIDRADVLEGGDVRIIDYKTGDESVDIGKMVQGYKMQLIIYLMSATSGELEPAGMFYFNIREPEEGFNDVNADKEKAALEASDAGSFKLSGKYIDKPGMLEKMPAEVISGRPDKNRLSPDKYEEVKGAVTDRLNELASGIVSGDISISPLRPSNQRMVCNFCDYKAICRYDSENSGNRSRELH